VGVRTDVRTAGAGDWRKVCDRTVDWVELMRPS
jgi:hypothetical protein